MPSDHEKVIQFLALLWGAPEWIVAHFRKLARWARQEERQGQPRPLKATPFRPFDPASLPTRAQCAARKAAERARKRAALEAALMPPAKGRARSGEAGTNR